MASEKTVNYRKSLLVWVPLLLVVWRVWLSNLDIGSLSFDETATYFVANRPPLEILPYLFRASNEHPPVYYLLIRVWFSMIGTSEFSLRLFSLSTGMILLVLTGWMAQLSARRHEGTSLLGLKWVAVILLAVSPSMVFYIRDARMYSLTAVWVVLASGLLLRDWLMTTERSPWTKIFLLAAVNGFAILTHYYMLLFIVTQPLSLLLTKRWRSFGIWSVIHVVPALVGLVWLFFAPGLQKTILNAFTNTAVPVPTTDQVLRLVAKMLSSSMSSVQHYVLPIVLPLLIVGIVVAFWRKWRVGVWLLLTLVTPFILAHLMPRTPQLRYIVFLMPFFILAVAHAIVLPSNLIHKRPIRWAVGVGLTGFMVWLIANAGLFHVLTTERSHYGRTIDIVQNYARPNDETLFYGPWQVIPFHYYGTERVPPRTLLPPKAPPLLDPIQAEAVLEEMFNRSERVWVIPLAVELVDPDLYVWEWLRTHAHRVWQQDDASLYVSQLADDAPATSLDLNFAEKLILEQIAYELAPIMAGEPIRLRLLWEILQPSSEGINLALSLVDETEYSWVTVDSLLQDNGFGKIVTNEGIVVPQGVPPGEYTLRLRLVDEANGLPILVNGAETVSLQSFEVIDPTQVPVLLDLPEDEAIQFCAPDEENCVNLAGFEPYDYRALPGYPLLLNLHWQSPSDVLPDLQARLQIIPDPWVSLADATPVVTKTLALSPNYPSAQWPSERLVTSRLVLSIPPDAVTGRAKVTLEVLDENGRIWLPHNDRDATLFQITIEERPTLTKLPNGLAPIEADFGEEIGLRGYRVDGDFCPGGQLVLTYGWQALKRPSQIYAVFNHLVGSEEVPTAQVDGWPQGGRLLTSQWQVGEYIEDSYVLDIPLDAAIEDYTLYVGFYAVEGGVRLPASQGGQRLPADRVPIPLPEMCE